MAPSTCSAPERCSIPNQACSARARSRTSCTIRAASVSTTPTTGQTLNITSHKQGRPVGRPDMDIEAHRDLKLLEAVEQDSRVTQRSLAQQLGIALGLTNIYLKRLVRKGYIKCVNVQSNRIKYLITPRGIAEKARLTYEFLDYSLHLYGEVRQHLRSVLQECAAADRRVAIYGRGEASALAYLSLQEFRLQPVATFDIEGGRELLGLPVP